MPKLCTTVDQIVENVDAIYAELPVSDEGIKNARKVHNWVAIFDPLMGIYKFAPVKYCGYEFNVHQTQILQNYFYHSSNISGSVSKVNLLKNLGFHEYDFESVPVEKISNDLIAFVEGVLSNNLRKKVTILIHPNHLKLDKISEKVLKIFDALRKEQREYVFMNIRENYQFNLGLEN